jgi:hypothetical protein
MSEAFKYIVLETTDESGDTHNIPVMFPKSINHDKMYETTYMAIRKSGNGHRPGKAISAGFCGYGQNGKVFCRGRSETLKLESRKELDEAIFQQVSTYGHTRVATAVKKDANL